MAVSSSACRNHAPRTSTARATHRQSLLLTLLSWCITPAMACHCACMPHHMGSATLGASSHSSASVSLWLSGTIKRVCHHWCWLLQRLHRLDHASADTAAAHMSLAQVHLSLQCELHAPDATHITGGTADCSKSAPVSIKQNSSAFATGSYSRVHTARQARAAVDRTACRHSTHLLGAHDLEYILSGQTADCCCRLGIPAASTTLLPQPAPASTK